MTHDTTRRDFLVLGGGAAAAVWLGDPESMRKALEAAREVAQGASVRYEVLTPEQAEDLEAVSAQILPSDDDLPGAREARAVVFIDRALNSHASDRRESLLKGLADLNDRVARGESGASRFAELTNEQQIAALREIEETPFFEQVRFSTIAGTFAHPNWSGNYDGAGYKILGFEPRFLWQPPFGEYDAEVNG
jgi:gluconate 2-dehydrogenase gamma chain